MKGKLLVLLFLAISVRLYGQSCSLTVNLTATNPVICSGAPVTLMANASAGTPDYTYAWSTGETTPNITVNKGDTYTVTVRDNTPGCQPVTQSITITEGFTPPAPVVSNIYSCLNSPATLTASGSPADYQWYDAPTGGTFLGSGATLITPVITAKTTFYVETTIDNCPSARAPVTVTPYSVYAGGNTTCPGTSTILTAGGAASYIWYDAPGGNQVGTGATFTTPLLAATTTYYVVGTTNGCASDPMPATANVLALPSSPTALSTSTCSGSVVALHASGGPANAVYDWFTTPTGGTSLISSPDFTTPALTDNTTYYVQLTSSNGCVSNRTAVTVTVNPIPDVPVVSDVSSCSGSRATLSATPVDGVIHHWYATATSSITLSTNDNYTTPVLGTSTDFYVSSVSSSSCESARVVVHVTVNPTPVAPTVSGQTICSGSTAVLTPTAPGGVYTWYGSATGPTPLITADSYTTPILTSNKTYYVETKVGDCVSPRTAVLVTVNPTPAAPTVSGVLSVCVGAATTLTASGAGSSFQWFDALVGGTPLGSDPSYTTLPLTVATTYYVQTTSAAGCISARRAVKVTVNALPVAPTAADQTVCAGQKAKLVATGSGGTVNWYDAAIGGALVFTGTTFTPTLSATKTYYVERSNGTCASTRSAVTVTVRTPGNQFAYSSGTYCKSNSTTTPVINVPGGTFSVSPSVLGGLDMTSTITGEIDIANSGLGRYTVTYTNGCSISTESIAIVTSPDASFAYAATAFCKDDVNPAPIFTTGTAGTITSSSPNLVLLDDNSGTIDLANSSPGKYKVTNTIDAAGGCTSKSFETTVFINRPVTITAGPNRIVASGTPVTLAGSIKGPVSSGTWSGGSENFSDPTKLNAVYTPAPGETQAVLTLTSKNPGTACGAKTSTVTITFNPKPSAPVVPAVPAICSGSLTTLAVTSPVSGTYGWFSEAAGGSALGSESTFPTPALTTTTTYYVQVTVDGVTSDRTPVTVTVNPIPDAPTVTPPGPVCNGSAATLIATAPGGIYDWYTTPTGGTSLFTGDTFVTQFLTANTTYYVQTTTAAGCVSTTRTRVDVIVNPVPQVIGINTGTVCSGSAQSYPITADLDGTTFTFTRAAVPGISNDPVTVDNPQPVTTLSETLINTTGANVNVTYMITPTLGGCSGVPFKYVVTVYPTPVVISENADIACSATNPNYNIRLNTIGTPISWSREAVDGISNPAISNQISSSIHESLVNTTNAPVDVNYIINYGLTSCPPGGTFKYTLTVNPTVIISSEKSDPICSGIPLNYVITSQVPTAVYSWSRAAVDGISNPEADNVVSGVIDESLINTTNLPVAVTYVITVIQNGCLPIPFRYTVTVYPTPPTPAVYSNSAICTGNTLKLYASALIPGGSYLWTGPAGFTSKLQNPTIPNATIANQGTYTVYLIANTCSSIAGTVDVMIDAAPVPHAGNDTTVCKTVTSVQLAGSMTGGSATGLWSSSGSGYFSPSKAVLNAQYIPSAADQASGSVTLTIASASQDGCAVATDDMVIHFQQVPAADAGADQLVCSQNTSITFKAKMLGNFDGTWIPVNGTGNFTPSTTQTADVSPTYILSDADKKLPSLQFILTANTNDPCYNPSDTMTVRFSGPPTVDAGPEKYLLKGNTTVLTPRVSDPTVSYKWTPDIDIDKADTKNPIVIGDIDRMYTLTVTDSLGCTATDSVMVKIAPRITVTNTFTPNGDGINDLWDITGLVAYTNATVDVFDRNGQKVYHSLGYGTAWDGRLNGKPLPFGTYYYIIDTKLLPVLSGSITIVR